jgi:hypothetical protein
MCNNKNYKKKKKKKLFYNYNNDDNNNFTRYYIVVLTLHRVKTRRASRSLSDSKGFPSMSGSIRPDSAVMNRYVAYNID